MDQTAGQPGDYTAVTTTALNWAAGARTQTQSVNVVLQGDNVVEGLEYLTLGITMLTGTNAAKGSIDPTRNTAQVFILDLSCKYGKYVLKYVKW